LKNVSFGEISPYYHLPHVIFQLKTKKKKKKFRSGFRATLKSIWGGLKATPATSGCRAATPRGGGGLRAIPFSLFLKNKK
jgi:hypothetical protein